ncbi:MAG TPA: hypothetical protein VI160_06625 [Gemmatimonadales bacterium]
MKRQGMLGLAVIAVAAIGCSEQSSLPPQMKVEASAAANTGTTCSFQSLSVLATHYFSSPETKLVRGMISAMQNAGAFSTTAVDSGFSVLSHIAANIKAGNGDAPDAANLTNGLLACMFANPADLPATFPEDFTVAVTPGDSGGFDVRGGAADLTGPVFSRPVPGSFSGVAPSGSNSWPAILAGNVAPKRIFVYGEPGVLPNTYDWRVIPRTTVFSPVAVVGVCLDANANATSLLHENAALLPFQDAAFLPTCAGLASGSWATPLLATIGRWGLTLVGPAPLSATRAFNPGGLAGSTGSIHSVFGPEVVDTVTLTFAVQPTDVTVNQVITPPVVVLATEVGTTTPVPNVTITLSSLNNNGTPALLSGTLTGTTDATGTVTFADLSQSKTGGYLLVATATVNGRPAIAVPTVNSARFNVRP